MKNKIILMFHQKGLTVKDVLSFLFSMLFLIASFIFFTIGCHSCPNLPQKSMFAGIMFFLFYLAIRKES